MKTKLIATIIAATAALANVSHAVTVNLAGIANATTGLITLDGSVTSGRAIFVSTTGADVRNGGNAAFQSILTMGGSSADFDAALTTLIDATSATSPGIVREVSFVDGVLLSTGPQELGNVGNFTHLFLVSESGGSVSGIGAYTGPDVPPLGAVTINANTAGDEIGIGTSTGGFQLVAVVPEPSVALLGMLGALGLVRRRR